jgi:hypothetical protein
MSTECRSLQVEFHEDVSEERLPAASIRDPEASPSESEVTADVAARGYRQA